ncbi:hypothetical protein BafACA1_I15 (plasmid) [Borreliella afzelii ACA-1]|nr:hypothetical protein BafACA1_I15 [Borreliella afzelii ACA-1]
MKIFFYTNCSIAQLRIKINLSFFKKNKRIYLSPFVKNLK